MSAREGKNTKWVITMDVLTPVQRKRNMQNIRGKDTKIEVEVRRELFKRGYRFRKNDSRFPGKPDIVLPKYKTVIFVNGCYWHRHLGCKYATFPKTNIDFWENKFRNNIENDARNKTALEEMGWKVITIWECELKQNFDETIAQTVKLINNA